MTNHTANSKHRTYRTFKAKIILRFGTLRAAARAVGCHHNSIRLAGMGRAPEVLQKLERKMS